MMETIPTEQLDQLLAAMVQSAEGVSDLLFVTGKPPQVEVHGKLKPYSLEPPESVLTSKRVEGIAGTIINGNERLFQDLMTRGSCDCSYALQNFCRFRVNIYRQNGCYAMVMRLLQSQIPTLDKLRLPPVFKEVIKEKNGLVFVTGATGSGKTTTLAAMLNEINQTNEIHVVTLEDPIEFLHPHLKSTFSQRELGRDFYTFPDGLRAALRQAPKVVLVGEIRDRETMEIALTAGETGHVVYSTLHTISAGQTIQRIIGMFTKDEEQQIRERLAGSLRYVISQRLVPKKDGGRLLVTELMGSSLRTREVIVLGESETRRFSDIIEAGNTYGWHSFEQSLIEAYEKELITEETALLHSVNKPMMHQRIDTVKKRKVNAPVRSSLKMKTETDAPKAAAPPPKPSAPSGSSTPVTTLLVAARDARKIEEIRSVLGEQFSILTLKNLSEVPKVNEDAPTFTGNATKKAVEVAQWFFNSQHAGVEPRPAFVLAMDSGLEVDALSGAPGVHSAHFAAQDGDADGGPPSDLNNNAKLLRLLKDVPQEKRTARFRCALALVPAPRGKAEGAGPGRHVNGAEMQTKLFEGVCEGRIISEPRGKNGFGYDPLFVPNGSEQTFAELDAAAKSRVSHRSQALSKVKLWLVAASAGVASTVEPGLDKQPAKLKLA